MTAVGSFRRGALVGERYRLEAILGRGGMATVYRALDERHQRTVALKVLRPELPPFAVESFLHEINLTARFNHPNILPLLDSGMAGGTPYFVMPLVRCRSLRHRLERRGRMSWDTARPLIAEVSDALQYAHGEGIVHLDVKPENILLSEGHAYVTDFGIARAACACVDPRDVVVGTPEYMSPEQAMGDPDIDGQSDVYSLAAVIHEVLTGAPPFRGASPAAVMYRRFREETKLSLAASVLNRAATAVLARGLATVPERRPAGPNALFLEMDEAMGSGGLVRAEGRWRSILRPARLAMRLG